MAVRKVDRLLQAITSHNVRAQQAILATTITEYIGVRSAAGDTDDVIIENVFTKFGHAITGWMLVDSLAELLDQLQGMEKRLPRRPSRVV